MDIERHISMKGHALTTIGADSLVTVHPNVSVSFTPMETHVHNMKRNTLQTRI